MTSWHTANNRRKRKLKQSANLHRFIRWVKSGGLQEMADALRRMSEGIQVTLEAHKTRMDEIARKRAGDREG
jgi:hypothetical protein